MTQHGGASVASSNKLPPTIVVGNFKVMYRPNGLYQTTKARLVHQGFQLAETEHFLFARPFPTDRVILVHRFLPAEIDNNLVDCLMQELPDLMISDQAFGHAMIGIVTSIKPHDPVSAWGIFSLNTLQRIREYLSENTAQYPPTTIGASATIYRRLFSLKVGISLLDVGCACAFWPVLVAERNPDASDRIVGVDNRLTAIHLSQHMATLIDKHNLTFLQLDLLSPQFVEKLGTFDTVTAIHILEHLPEEQLPLAFEHLLAVTHHRLIVAVPFEAKATLAYGHEQVFTREKLERWGQWCVESICGTTQYRCEEEAGGLLIIDRIDQLSS
ncbi:MAG: class I SAM-dependent methyltransferase [Ktedonobacteraceae bacterium]